MYIIHAWYFRGVGLAAYTILSQTDKKGHGDNSKNYLQLQCTLNARYYLQT